jgi:hypothetical protein
MSNIVLQRPGDLATKDSDKNTGLGRAKIESVNETTAAGAVATVAQPLFRKKRKKKNEEVDSIKTKLLRRIEGLDEKDS